MSGFFSTILPTSTLVSGLTLLDERAFLELRDGASLGSSEPADQRPPKTFVARHVPSIVFSLGQGLAETFHRSAPTNLLQTLHHQGQSGDISIRSEYFFHSQSVPDRPAADLLPATPHSPPVECSKCFAINLRDQAATHTHCRACGTKLSQNKKRIKAHLVENPAVAFLTVDGMNDTPDWRLRSRRFVKIMDEIERLAGSYGVFVDVDSGGKFILATGVSKKDRLETNAKLLVHVLRELQGVLNRLSEDDADFRGTTLTSISGIEACPDLELVYGEVGVHDSSFTIIGSPANVAARVQAHGKIAYQDAPANFPDNQQGVIFLSDGAVQALDGFVSSEVAVSLAFLKGIGERDIHVVNAPILAWEETTGEVKSRATVKPPCELTQEHSHLRHDHCVACGISGRDVGQGVEERYGFGTFVTWDLANYTQFSQGKTPKAVLRHLRNNFYFLVEEAVALYGGRIVDKNADEVIAMFPPHARDKALKAIQHSLMGMNENNSREGLVGMHAVRTRVGVAEGEFHTARGRVISDAVNLARLAQDLAEPDEVVVHSSASINMARMARMDAVGDSGGTHFLKFDRMRAGAAVFGVASFVPGQRLLDSSILQARFDLARAGKLQAVVMTGPTRHRKVLGLVDLLGQDEVQNSTLLYGGASPTQTDPVREALGQFLDAREAATPMEALRELFRELDMDPALPIHRLRFNRVAEYLGIQTHEVLVERAGFLPDRTQHKNDTRRAVAEFVKRLSVRSPLILILFNMGAMDANAKLMMKEVLIHNERSKVFVVGFMDTEASFEFDWHLFFNGDHPGERFQDQLCAIQTQPLDANAVREALRIYYNEEFNPDASRPLEAGQIGDDVVASYHDRSQGDLEHLRIWMRYDVNEGYLTREPLTGNLVLLERGRAIAEIDALLAARVDDLSSGARSLYHSVVVATRFDSRFFLSELPESASRDPLYLREDLAELMSARLIAPVTVEGEGQYRLMLPEAGEARYRQLESVRRRMHAEAVAFLSQKVLTRARDRALVAFHQAEAGMHDQALLNYRLAADQSLRENNDAEALSYLDHMQVLLGRSFGEEERTHDVRVNRFQRRRSVVEEILRLCENLIVYRREWRHATEAYSSLLEDPTYELLDRRTQDEILFASVLFRNQYLIYHDRDAAVEASAGLVETVGSFESMAPTQAARICRTIASSYSRVERLDLAEIYYRDALRFALASDDEAVQANVRFGYSSMLVRRGGEVSYRESLRIGGEAEGYYRYQASHGETDDAKRRAATLLNYILINRGNAHKGLGEYDRAVEAFSEVDGVARDNPGDFDYAHYMALINWAITLIYQGEIDAAKGMLERTLASYGDTVSDEERFIVQIFLQFTNAFLSTREAVCELLALSENAEFMRARDSMPSQTAVLHLALAIAYFQLDQRDEAQKHADWAMSIRELRGGSVEDLDAELVSFSLLLGGTSLPDDAPNIIRQLHGTFSQTAVATG